MFRGKAPAEVSTLLPRVLALGSVAAVLCLLGSALVPSQALSQDDPPRSPVAAPNAPSFSPPQLEQMVAPIALYPDQLLGQVLMASTYPLEVVEAARWLQDPANASLHGSVLADALQQQSWDPSVKSLVAFPQVLTMLDGNLDWTEQLGDAFLAQQADVMDAVQRLRARSQAAGRLAPSAQEAVTSDGQEIAINPADSNVVYVPVYDPQVAYGDWPYPDYPPDDFYITGYPVGSFIGVSILWPWWGWNRWDWPHHQLQIGGGPPFGGGDHRPPGPYHPWQHDPSHRRGVLYRDAATRSRYEGAEDAHAIGSGFRGYSTTTREIRPSTTTVRPPSSAPVTPPAYRESYSRPSVPSRAPAYSAPAPIERPAPPVYESYGRGSDVHVQEQRGASSRMSAPPSRGSSGGGGGGGGRGRR